MFNYFISVGLLSLFDFDFDLPDVRSNNGSSSHFMLLYFHCYLQLVGCDHFLHSRKLIDRCGVCGGKADTCLDETGSFTAKIASET